MTTRKDLFMGVQRNAKSVIEVGYSLKGCGEFRWMLRRPEGREAEAYWEVCRSITA